jgi:hypothetical protein
VFCNSRFNFVSTFKPVSRASAVSGAIPPSNSIKKKKPKAKGCEGCCVIVTRFCVFFWCMRIFPNHCAGCTVLLHWNKEHTSLSRMYSSRGLTSSNTTTTNKLVYTGLLLWSLITNFPSPSLELNGNTFFNSL